jgi:septum formation protein
MRIILASKSPRRLDILRAHGIEPFVAPSLADETLPEEIESAGPEPVVLCLARAKARDVLGRLSSPDADPRMKAAASGLPGEVILLAADTIVYLDGIIGKPADADDAFAILSRLRGRTHEVWSGVTLVDCMTGVEDSFAVRTRVTFKDYPDEEIRRFIREEKPFDKSGSYAIQSSWSRNVARVDGGIENVVGLPWPEVEAHLERMSGNTAG